jgi:hypothetical protein
MIFILCNTLASISRQLFCMDIDNHFYNQAVELTFTSGKTSIFSSNEADSLLEAIEDEMKKYQVQLLRRARTPAFRFGVNP